MFQGLRTTIYRVPDLAAAKAWYTNLLGNGPYFDEPFYVGYNVGGYELGLIPIENPSDGPEVVTYWGVPSADEAFTALVAQGASSYQPVEEVGDGIRTGAVKDPYGNIIGVIENPHFKLD